MAPARKAFGSASPGRFLFLLLVGALSYKLIIDLKDLHPPPPITTDNIENVPCEEGPDKKQCPACAIPQLDPFDTRIQHLLQKPPDWDCESRYSLLFNSTWDSRVIPDEGLIRKEGYLSCCYRTLKGLITNDNITVSPKCYPLSITKATRIPDQQEFIGIYCKKGSEGSSVPVDVHAFVRKPGRKGKIGSEEGEGKWNVVVFGMDAMSRMNFHRNLPRSIAFLKGEMGGVEMTGYNKLDQGTVKILLPFLTSKKVSQLMGCGRECPYIWRKYSAQGYSTAYVEDSFESSLTGSLVPAFNSHPPDHYLRPAVTWASTHINHSQVYDRNYACLGPRLTFQLALDHMTKFVERMSQSHRNFFHFTWAGTLTHNHQAGALLVDPHLLKSLQWLKGSGYLDKTIFVLMGDHGNRLEPFHASIQGQLEDRLPGMFLVFPDSFKRSYARAYRNLVGNRDKLMTVLDLRETLLDLLELESIQEPALESREKQMSSLTLPPRGGRSLFLPIPGNRSCAMAGIERNYCSCNYMKPVPLPLDSPFLAQMANMAISQINSELQGHPQLPCAQLRLQNVTSAQESGHVEQEDWKGYTIMFETQPGGGQFQVWIDWNASNNRSSIQDNIERSNQYGPTSGCAKDKKEIRPYCYCLDKTSAPSATLH